MCGFVVVSCHLHCRYSHHLTRTSSFQLKCVTVLHKPSQDSTAQANKNIWESKLKIWCILFMNYQVYKEKQIGFRIEKLSNIAFKWRTRNNWLHHHNPYDTKSRPRLWSLQVCTKTCLESINCFFTFEYI